MTDSPLHRVRTARMQALRNGATTDPMAFGFWDEPALLTVDGDVFEIHFNDMIDDWFGISSAMVVEALLAADGRDVLVHLNSPGGMVTEGLSIHSTLKQYSGNITVRVEGFAASAASFVMLAADSLLIEPNAMVMIHDASDYGYGTEAVHRKRADLLGKISNNIASMYAGKAGGEAKKWRALMLDETWYVGEEAVTAGLVDSLTPERDKSSDSAATARQWGGIFAGAPRGAGGKVAALATPPPEPPETSAPLTLADLTAHLETLGLVPAAGRDMPAVEPAPVVVSPMDAIKDINVSALLKDALKVGKGAR